MYLYLYLHLYLLAKISSSSKCAGGVQSLRLSGGRLRQLEAAVIVDLTIVFDQIDKMYSSKSQKVFVQMAKCICAEASERRKLWAAAGSAAQCGTHRRLGRSADSLAARLRLELASLLRRQFAEIRRPA